MSSAVLALNEPAVPTVKPHVYQSIPPAVVTWIPAGAICAMPPLVRLVTRRINDRGPVTSATTQHDRALEGWRFHSGWSSPGAVVEACNSGGYTVTANYRDLETDEAAVFNYNGQAIALPADGEVVVHVSDIATVKQVVYALQSQHLDSPLQLTLHVTAA